jgi:Tfp pilus assembly protein PilX
LLTGYLIRIQRENDRERDGTVAALSNDLKGYQTGHKFNSEDLMKDPLKNDRGIALAVGIMVVVLLLTIIGAIMTLGRLDLKKTSNHKLGTQALEIADAALQHALAVIPDGANFPYTSPTTIVPSGTVYLSMPGFTYTVVASNINGGVQAILTATAEHTASGTKRVIEAYADRGTYGLGAVHLEGSAGVMETEFAGTSFEISGTDECGVQPTVAGITVTDPDLETEITNDTTDDGGLTADQMDNVTGLGGVPSVLTLYETPTSVSEIADAFLALAGVVEESGGNYGGNEVWGTEAVPQITHITGDANIGGNLEGYGVIIVDGSVQIAGNLNFSGLIIARGEVGVKVTGDAGIKGSLMLEENENQDEAIELDIRGNARIKYNSCTLSTALDSTVGTNWVPIPKPVRLLGWKENM